MLCFASIEHFYGFYEPTIHICEIYVETRLQCVLFVPEKKIDLHYFIYHETINTL